MCIYCPTNLQAYLQTYPTMYNNMNSISKLQIIFDLLKYLHDRIL